MDAVVIAFAQYPQGGVIGSLGVQPVCAGDRDGGVPPAMEQQVRSVDPSDRGDRRELGEPISDNVFNVEPALATLGTDLESAHALARHPEARTAQDVVRWLTRS